MRASSGGCTAQGERRGAAPHPGRNLRRCSIVAFSLRSTARFASRLRLAVSSAGRAHLQHPALLVSGFASHFRIHASGLARSHACGRANIARFSGQLRRTKRTAGRCPAPRQEPSPALNRRILPPVDCSFRTAPSARCFGHRPRSPSASCTFLFRSSAPFRGGGDAISSFPAARYSSAKFPARRRPPSACGIRRPKARTAGT